MIAFFNRNLLFTLFLSLSLSLISTVAHADIIRSAFTSSIQNREPVDNLKHLNRDLDAVFFFTEITNMKGRSITHKWKQGGVVYNNITFEIGSHRWRVNSSKGLATTSKRGTWVVTVTDDEGVVLIEESISYGNASSSTSSTPSMPPAVINKPAPKKAEAVTSKPKTVAKSSDEDKKSAQPPSSKAETKPEKTSTATRSEKKEESTEQVANKPDEKPIKKIDKPTETTATQKTEESKPSATTQTDKEKETTADSDKPEKTAAQSLAEKKASIKSQVLQATGRAEEDEFENFDKDDDKEDEPKAAETSKATKADNKTVESEKAAKDDQEKPATESSKKETPKEQEQATLSSKQPEAEETKSSTPKPIWDTL